MTEDRQKIKGTGFGSEFFPGSGFDLENFMDPDPVCPERLDLDPDQVNIRTDSKPCLQQTHWLKRKNLSVIHLDG